MTTDLVIFRNTPCKIIETVADKNDTVIGHVIEALFGAPFSQLYTDPAAWRPTNRATAAPAEVTPLEKTAEIERIERELAAMEEQQKKLSENCQSLTIGSDEHGDALAEYFLYCEDVTAKRAELAAAWDEAIANPQVNDTAEWLTQGYEERP